LVHFNQVKLALAKPNKRCSQVIALNGKRWLRYFL
jgi:hypothetical protein